MLEFCQWLQQLDLYVFMRGSGIIYPAILALHMVAIAFFGMMILVTDLRLLGVAFKDYPLKDLLDRLRVPKYWGLALIVTCGILLFGAKAEEYYYNIFFRLKMVILLLILLHGAIFRASVYRNGAALDTGGLSGQAKLAGALSLLLWVSMAICGRGIGYIEPNLLKLHAQAGEASGSRHQMVAQAIDARMWNTNPTIPF